MESFKPQEKDHYSTLGVPPDAPLASIKKSYHALALLYHPDRYQFPLLSEMATLRMFEINEAFEILSNAQRRAEYDAGRNAPKAPPQAPPAGTAPPAKAPAQPKAAPQSADMDQAVIQEFLQALKKSMLEQGGPLKLKEQEDHLSLWSFSGKTSSGSCWISLRSLQVMNANAARECLSQVTDFVAKRRSMWRNIDFVFVLAFGSLYESETVVKLCRAYCNQEENSGPKSLVNIVLMESATRRSLLCGKRSEDPELQRLVNTLATR